MNSHIVGNFINHFNHHSITFPCYNRRTWETSIHANNALRLAQPCHIVQRNLTFINS